MNTTNNHLENFNGKLKEVIDFNSTLENLLDKFYVLLTSMRNERDHQTIYQMQKIYIDMFETNSAEAHFKEILTSYAFQLVLKQMTLGCEVKFLSGEYNNDIVKSSEGQLKVTSISCVCMFFKSMSLPCRHIFALRQLQGMNLFDAELCTERWTREYYRQHQRVFSTPARYEEPYVKLHTAPRKKILSQHEKFKLALQATSFLATLVSESAGHTFEQRMNLLQALQKGWEHGKVMVVNEFVEKDSIFLTPDFSIAGVQEGISTSSTVEESFHSELEKLADLNGNPQKKDKDIREVLSEQSVVDSTKPHQEECLVVKNEGGITVKYKFRNCYLLLKIKYVKYESCKNKNVYFSFWLKEDSFTSMCCPMWAAKRCNTYNYRSA